MNQTDVLKMMNTASRPESRNGLWTGRVEAIDDPEFMDRVKVRVFAIHGDNRQTPVEALPWAEVQGLEGGGSDYGTAGRRYPIGSSVWVQFEQGDDDFPVVTGARRCKAPVRNDKNPLEFMTLGGQEWSTTEQAWTPSETSEMPKDVFASSANEDRHPTRTVWHKSLKGHTIMCEDRDGAEFLRIIDRAGQTIEMSCPVTVEANANNGEQRGSKSSITDDQVSQDKLVNGRAFIRLKDVSGQEITLDGASANESITIKSRNRNNTAVQKITLSSAKGRERIEILDKEGNTLVLDPNNPVSILIKDSAGSMIEFDTDKGVIRSTSTNSETTRKGYTTELLSGARVTTVAEDNTHVLGNKFLDVLNDFSASIAGLTSVIATGPVSLAVANGSMSGVPAPNGIDIQLLVGNISLTAVAGIAMLNALAGAVQLNAGAAVQINAGAAAQINAVGAVQLTSPTTFIGSPVAAEPLVLGAQLLAALADFVRVLLQATSIPPGVIGVDSVTTAPVVISPALVTELGTWLSTWIAPGTIVSATRFTQK